MASQTPLAWDEPTNGWASEVELPLTSPAVVPATDIDHQLVREVRREVAEQLAARLQAEPLPDPQARRELGRALLTDVLAGGSVQRVHDGKQPWTVDEEYALADAVMAALFGLGRLQPLIDDPDIENIEVNGHDEVWLSYADGREERGPSVADSDASASQRPSSVLMNAVHMPLATSPAL